MRDALRGARAAFVFLTRIPVGGGPYSPGAWRWAPAWFPLVGLVVGGAEAALLGLATPRVGSLVAACLATIAALLLTGAFHEDGLADTADALGGSHDREKLFLILKDSRVGAFGAAALVVALLLRVALLARLGAVGASTALLAAECASRLPPVGLATLLPYVTPDAQSKSRHVARPGAPQLAVATLVTVVVLAALAAAHVVAPVEAAGILAAGALAAIVCGARFVARAGGVTGDFLGATQQIAVCAMLVADAWLRGCAT